MSTSDIYCSSCGASNDLDASACFACGKLLAETADENDSPTTVLSRGTLLHNRYLLLNPVGEGGFATVYRAEDTLSHRTVAIKSIGLAALNAQQVIDATDTYNRELLFGRALKHPHLPAFYDSFTDQDHWYLVVQFIDGPTLETYVQQRPAQRLALWEVLDIGMQICEVLTYLHSRRPAVIFRDIKPDNIMRAANGTVYLVDFGIARHFHPGKRRDTQLLGSPGYAAPEQYGSAQTSERSDIYSLGVTLQTLLTGGNPLDNKGNHTFAPASVLPRDVEKLLERMHAQKPEDRPASALEVRSALEDIARAQGISSLIPRMQVSQGSDWQPYNTSMTPSFAYGGQQMSQMVPPPPPMTPLPSYASPVKKRKRSIAGWITAGLVASVLVCVFGSMIVSNHPSSPQPDQSLAVLDKNTLAIGLVESSGSAVLDPTLQASAQEQQVMTMLYSGLTTVNGQNKVVPGLAQSWDARPDGQSLDWTFHLRPNLKFSNGSPLTSADVAYSIDRVFSSPNNEYAYLAPFFKDGSNRLSGKVQTLIGDSLLTPDPSTLIIKEQGNGVFLPTMMSTYSFLVVNQSLVKKYGSSGFTSHLDEGGSSGPFKLSGSAGSGANNLDLVPNAAYYGSQSHLKKVSVMIYATSTDERAAYNANQLSVMLAPEYDSLTNAEKSDEQVSLVSAVDYIGMNYLAKPFDNIKIRQAFALALDKPAIMDGAYKAGSLATNHIIPEGQPGYNQALTGPAGVSSPHGDAALARRLLQQGMQEEGIQSIQQFPAITLTYYSVGSVSRTGEMDLIQKQWNTTLGIQIKLDDNPQLNDKINSSVNNPKGLQLWLSGWLVDYPDPQNWTSLQFAKGSSWNSSNYGQNNSADAPVQQQVQANLLKADAMKDPQQRLKAYQAAEQQLVNDVAWLPISQNNHADLVKSDVRGYQTNEGGFVSPDVLQAISIN